MPAGRTLFTNTRIKIHRPTFSRSGTWTKFALSFQPWVTLVKTHSFLPQNCPKLCYERVEVREFFMPRVSFLVLKFLGHSYARLSRWGASVRRVGKKLFGVITVRMRTLLLTWWEIARADWQPQVLKADGLTYKCGKKKQTQIFIGELLKWKQSSGEKIRIDCNQNFHLFHFLTRFLKENRSKKCV